MTEMLVVGDIGSTKSAWRTSLHDDDIQLPGYNPLTHSDDVLDDIFTQFAALIAPHVPGQLWYYGAGVIDDASRMKITQRFHLKFPSSQIIVESDLMGAVRAACGSNPGSIVILGTGSHAASFDGRSITQQASPMGFILGDEGSGADIGKELIRAYFYNQMPHHIASQMTALMPSGGRIGFLHKLSTSAAPNTFLAGFSRVAVANKADQWICQLVTRRLHAFVDHHVLPLHPTSKIHVIGSIGFIFAGLLQDVLKESSLETGEFIQHPIARLAQYHFEL